MMFSKLIIAVTGSKGSGKTHFSKLLAQKTGLQVINVGDLLERQLETIGVQVKERTKIGSAFFAHFSDDQYYQIIKSAACSGVIIEGIRLVWALKKLKSEKDNILHIHLINEPKLEHSDVDGYEGEESVLRQIADVHIDLNNLTAEPEKIIKNIIDSSR